MTSPRDQAQKALKNLFWGPFASARRRRRATTETATEKLVEFDLMIACETASAASVSTCDSVDPYTRRPWAHVPADVDRAMAAARAALNGPWSHPTATTRGKLLRRIGEIITREAENVAELEVRDGGKLTRAMVSQMKALPDYYFYYAGLASQLLHR